MKNIIKWGIASVSLIFLAKLAGEELGKSIVEVLLPDTKKEEATIDD